MGPDVLIAMLQGLLAKYSWMFIVGFVGLFFKDMIKEVTAGVAIFIGNDFNEDDIVYISGRKARIARVGLRKTVFVMLDSDPPRKCPVMNHRLQGMNIEKTLPQNGIGQIRQDIKDLQEKLEEK